ncbi:MAG: MBL fold metallo-hydrolase [Fusobacteriaceae bacterium]|jgi:glyoxylase-like metal-dependent hydrolase (beta-lactamase superfamily II)|nr:MBL fold metallo-hydrolase [Fusobacteriaceae bacterium]
MKKALISVLVFFSLALFAGAQNFKTYAIGDSEFTALSDSVRMQAKSVLLQPDAEIVKKVLPGDETPGAINGYVLKTPQGIMLFDTGLGANGSLWKSLKEAGIDAKLVRRIFLTHMHGDHIGGLLTPEGKPVFEKAMVYVNDQELEFWLSDKPANKDNIRMAKAVKEAYDARLETFVWGQGITGYITAMEAKGHTPGHTAFLLKCGPEIQDQILVVGDLVHVIPVQFADPSLSVRYDIDPAEAAVTRKKYLDLAFANKYRIAGMHIPFTGVGYVQKGDIGEYKFVPEQ